jgi:hypothetical protein
MPPARQAASCSRAGGSREKGRARTGARLRGPQGRGYRRISVVADYEDRCAIHGAVLHVRQGPIRVLQRVSRRLQLNAGGFRFGEEGSSVLARVGGHAA